jgi:DNA polymerase
MNEAQRRAWRALELGPAWRLRAGATGTRTGAGTGASAGAETGAADGEAVGAAHVAPAPGGSDEARAAAVARMDWTALREAVAGCRACALCGTRTQTVFGVGNERARWMFVGEAPGAEEDARGEPFVGQAGRLLDGMLAALGLERQRDAYIANVLKCRPPGNRNPEPDEVRHCEPFLRRQLELVSPGVIVVLGRFAAQSLLQTEASIASLRGRVHRYEAAGRDIAVVVTYHPAYLLRNMTDKAKAWADLCLARSCLRD